MKTKLTKEELMAEYGVSDQQKKAKCTITLNCAWGSISCSSDKGDCKQHSETFQLSDGTEYEIVTSISCDGEPFPCKDNRKCGQA